MRYGCSKRKKKNAELTELRFHYVCNCSFWQLATMNVSELRMFSNLCASHISHIFTYSCVAYAGSHKCGTHKCSDWHTLCKQLKFRLITLCVQCTYISCEPACLTHSMLTIFGTHKFGDFVCHQCVGNLPECAVARIVES